MSAPSIMTVMKAASLYYGLSDIRQPSQKRAVARPRQVAMYVARQMTGRSYPMIGRMFHRDHATVHFGICKVEALRKHDARIAADIQAISAIVASGVVQ